MDFFRLEDRMLFEAAAAANIVAAADAANDANDDGANDDDKHNELVNVAILAAPEVQANINEGSANQTAITNNDAIAVANDPLDAFIGDLANDNAHPLNAVNEIGATRAAARHVVSIDFNAHKTYDGTVDIGQDALSLDIDYDGEAASSSLVSYADGVWTFNIDTPNDDFTIVLSDAHFADRNVDTDAEASIDIALQGDNLNLYTFVFEDTSIDGSGSSVSLDDNAIDGSIDRLALTITVNDTNVKYGNENADGDFTTFKGVTLESALGTGNDALGAEAISALEVQLEGELPRTDSGHIKVDTYEDVLVATGGIFGRIEKRDISSNYDITIINGDLIVEKRDLTIQLGEYTIEYGDYGQGDVIDGEYTYSGDELASGDTLTYTLAINADISSTGHFIVGDHQKGLILNDYTLSNPDNYNVSYNEGSVHVTPREAIISFEANDKVYDGTTDATQKGDYIVSGLLENAGMSDDVVVIGMDMDFNFDTPFAGEDKTVTATSLSSENPMDSLKILGDDFRNYNFTFIDTTLANIDKRPVHIKANDQTIAQYGEAAPALDGEYTVGEGEVLDIDTLAVTLKYTAPMSAAGFYVAGFHEDAVDKQSISITHADSYEIFFEQGDLTVGKRQVTIKADDHEITYGDDIPDFTWQLIAGSFVGDDTPTGPYVLETPPEGDKPLDAGEYAIVDGGIVLDDNYELTILNGTLTVDKRELTIKFQADDKVYDATTDAERLGDFTVTGLVDGESIALDDSAMTYHFSDKNVGNGKTVTATGFELEYLSGTDIDNYDITFVDTAVANITPLAITIGFTANDKVYDGNASATRKSLDMSQVLEGDDVNFDDTTLEYNFSDKNVEDGKTVTATSFTQALLSGEDLANYTVEFDDTALANITPRPITIGFTANDKVYDGNASATRKSLDMSQVLEGDDVIFDDSTLEYNFSDKNVEDGKTVTATGFTQALLSGDDLANYTVEFDDTALANITPLAITIGFQANDKPYDGTTDATRKGDLIISGAIDGDDIQAIETEAGVSYAFDQPTVLRDTDGSILDRDVTATGNVTLTGNDASNYTFTFINKTTAKITPIDVTVTAYDQSMTYGDANPSLDGQYTIEGLLAIDSLTVTLKYDTDSIPTSASGHFKAGEHDDVIIEANHTLTNADSYNYHFVAADLTVAKRQVTIKADDHEITYGDDIPDFTWKLVDGSFVGDDTPTGPFVLENPPEGDKPLDVGEYAIVDGGIVLDDNYELTILDGTLTVDKHALTITFQAADKYYNATTDAERLGDFTVTGLVDGESIALDDSTMTYHFSDKNVGNGKTVTATGFELEFLSGTDIDNYNITFVDTTTANIMPLAITIGFTANDKVYDGNANATRKSLDMSQVIAGDDVVFDDSTLEYNFSDKNVEDGKTVTATGFTQELLSGDDLANYDITFADTTTANITPLAITIGFQANDKPYDGTTDATRKGDLIISGAIDGDDIQAADTGVSYAFTLPTVNRDTDGSILVRDVTATGDVTLSGSDAANYTFTFVNRTTAKITPIDVTVTAYDQSMTYGDANPSLDGQYTVEGLLAIDSLSVTLAYDVDNIPTSASGHFKAGEHDDVIVEADHTLSNADSYNYPFVAADLTVAKRPITIAADDKEITYGDEVGDLTYAVIGDLADGDSMDAPNVQVDGEPNDNGHLNAGTYDIIIDELSLDENDYDITYDPGELIVNPKAITIIADDKAKEEHRPDPTLTYTVDGLLDDDELTGKLTRKPGERPGDYEIQQGGLTADDNYVITYIPGTLTIVAAPEDPAPPYFPVVDDDVPEKNITQEPEEGNRNYNGPELFEPADYIPIIPYIHAKWDYRSRFDDHNINPLANSQDLWMDIDSLDTILVSKVISASDSANERGFSSGNELFPNNTQTPIYTVHLTDDLDSPIIEPDDFHGSIDPLPQPSIDDSTPDDGLGLLAGLQLDEPLKNTAFKSDVELLLDGFMA